MSKKKRTHPVKPAAKPHFPARLNQQLQEAYDLADTGDIFAAHQLLLQLNQQFPLQVPVLNELLATAMRLHDHTTCLAVSRNLLYLQPAVPENWFNLGISYLHNGLLFLTRKTLGAFLEQWPDHGLQEKARQAHDDVEKVIGNIREDLGLPPVEATQLAELHEQLQMYVQDGDIPRAEALVEQIHQIKSDFLPPLNNLCLAYLTHGRFDEAIATSHRILAIKPDNCHGLSNLIRLHCMCGRFEEAKSYGERLKAAPVEMPDHLNKKMEALSYLGDDLGVLEIYESVKQMQETGHPNLEDGYFLHLAAVALHRTGKTGQAKKLLKKAGAAAPHLKLVQDNLADSSQPEGQREGPWAFSAEYWIPAPLIRQFAVKMTPTIGKSQSVQTKAMTGLLKEYPSFIGIAPAVLERGDGGLRQVMLQLAAASRHPALLQAIRDFALSQNGSDHMRMEAAQLASQTGLLPSGMVRFWSKGQWTEVMLLGFEINSEPNSPKSPKIGRLLQNGFDLLSKGNGTEAEKVFRHLLQLEPDFDSAMFNLAAALRIQNRDQEANDLIREIFAKHPNYSFGRLDMARIKVQEKEFDEARQLLEPIYQLKKLHVSEFRIFCLANMELFWAEKKKEGVRTWLGLWEQIEPHHPGIQQWKDKLDGPAYLADFFEMGR